MHILAGCVQNGKCTGIDRIRLEKGKSLELLFYILLFILYIMPAKITNFYSFWKFQLLTTTRATLPKILLKYFHSLKKNGKLVFSGSFVYSYTEASSSYSLQCSSCYIVWRINHWPRFSLAFIICRALLEWIVLYREQVPPVSKQFTI